MKVAVLFDNFGPYHLARLCAAASLSELLAVEVAVRSAEYAWKGRRAEGKAESGKRKVESGNDTPRSAFKIVTLLENGTSREARRHDLVRKMAEALGDFKPQVVFVPGWSSKAAFAAMDWCVRHQVPIVAMSESTEWDEKRAFLREWVKMKIVHLSSSSLVGGSPHKEYIARLGMAPDTIFTGYDAVDNPYFADRTAEVGDQRSRIRNQNRLPENYFLASARFIGKKNLPRLISAYSVYVRKSKIKNQKSKIWSLVLLGDGPLRETLNAQLSTLSLHDRVQMPGFIQYPDLPVYYNSAKAFIHASTTEPWGLVVNEAMASGLPVLVSNRCGCAADLVQEGVNGYTFDPYNVEEIAPLMIKISDSNFPLSAFGSASRRIISNWGPRRFAQGLRDAADKALEVGPVKATLLQRALLKVLK